MRRQKLKIILLWGVIPSIISFFIIMVLMYLYNKKNMDFIGKEHKDISSSILSIVIYFFIATIILMSLLHIMISDMYSKDTSVFVTSGLKMAILLVLSGFGIQIIYFLIRCLLNGINYEIVKSTDNFTVIDKLDENETSWITFTILLVFSIISWKLIKDDEAYKTLFFSFIAIFLGKIAWLNTSPISFIVSILKIFRVPFLSLIVGIFVVVEGLCTALVENHANSITIGMCIGGLLGFIVFLIFDTKKNKNINIVSNETVVNNSNELELNRELEVKK